MSDVFEKCRRFTRAAELEALGLYPYFQPLSETNGTQVVVHGRKLILTGSNNYLGLTHHPYVQEAARRAVERFGTSCTGSRFLTGTLSLHEELEERLANFLGREAALTFATGFMTNLGTIGTLVGRGEVILCDRENHASIIDACRLSFGTVRKFRHNDTADLERQLEATGDVGKFIVVDGVFSMSGDIVDLPGMLSVAKRYGARVMVDDAHSCGVLGENGRGTEEHHHLQGQTDLIMGTFSKSFASVGGFIAGPKEVVSFVKHQSRPFIFSAAASPAMVASALAALDIMEREPEHRERLWRNVRKVSTALRELGFDTQGSRTPIIPVLIGDDLAALHFWKRLFERGIFTTPALNPAVPEGRAIIRTSYTAAHSPEQLDRVIEAFALTGRETGVIA